MSLKIDPPAKNSELISWLESQAKEHSLPFLLTHAEDGVIWGQFLEDGSLSLAGGSFQEVDVALRLHTIQQLRLFGPEGELIMWRSKKQLSASLTLDGEQTPDNALDEEHLLWGEGERSDNRFTLCIEGVQGLHHAPPIKDATGKQITLKVRNYFSKTAQGQFEINSSRLVDLATKEGTKHVK